LIAEVEQCVIREYASVVTGRNTVEGGFITDQSLQIVDVVIDAI
jgi:hypothetical protein